MYHFEWAGDHASGVRDGNAGAHLSEVEGGDSPAVGWRQDLLRVRETLVEDLAYPGEGVRDSLEVAAAGLGHRRATTPASSQYARDLSYYLPGLDPTGDLGVKVGDENSLAFERSGQHHGGRTTETILVTAGLRSIIAASRSAIACDCGSALSSVPATPSVSATAQGLGTARTTTRDVAHGLGTGNWARSARSQRRSGSSARCASARCADGVTR